MRLTIICCALSAYGALVSLSAQQPTAAQFHPPAERLNAAELQPLRIPSHGSLLNAFLYVAAGAEPHPTVILLHGLPGNERNLDLAQDILHAGWNVLYMDYRGSWGSPGEFSFSHSVEDVSEALAYLRQPAVAARSRLDPQRFVLMGHSMGGFVAVQAAADQPSVIAVALISPVDFGGMIPEPLPKDQEAAVVARVAAGIEHQGIAPLSGCTPDGIARDILTHARHWKFSARADSLKTRPVFLITSDDGWADSNDAFASDLRRAGTSSLTTRRLATDHAYSDQRKALSSEILEWLSTLRSAGR